MKIILLNDDKSSLLLWTSLLDITLDYISTTKKGTLVKFKEFKKEILITPNQTLFFEGD